MRSVSDHGDAPADAARIRQAIIENVEEQVNTLLQESTTLKSRVDGGQVAIVGGYYESLSGIVHFSEPIRLPPRHGRRASTESDATAGSDVHRRNACDRERAWRTESPQFRAGEGNLLDLASARTSAH